MARRTLRSQPHGRDGDTIGVTSTMRFKQAVPMPSWRASGQPAARSHPSQAANAIARRHHCRRISLRQPRAATLLRPAGQSHALAPGSSRPHSSGNAEADRRRAEAIAAAGGDDALTPAKKAAITKCINRDVARAYGFGDRIPKPPATFFSGAQGSGKTRFSRQYIAQHGAGAVWWLTEPTTAKAREEFEAYLEDDGPNKPPAMHMRGRDQSDPQRPGHQMCDRAATAERVAKAGLPILTTLCAGCPFNCGDRRQRKEAAELVEAGEGAVFFLAGEYVFLPAPAPRPDHAIFDESLILPAIKLSTISLADVRAFNVGTWGTWGTTDTAALDRVEKTLVEVCDAIDTHWSRTPGRVADLYPWASSPRSSRWDSPIFATTGSPSPISRSWPRSSAMNWLPGSLRCPGPCRTRRSTKPSMPLKRGQ